MKNLWNFWQENTTNVANVSDTPNEYHESAAPSAFQATDAVNDKTTEDVLLVNNTAFDRQMVLANQTVPYRIERTRRRTVGLVITGGGVRVRAAPSVSVAEIERILQAKSRWIVNHLRSRDIPNPPDSPHQPTPIAFVPDFNLLLQTLRERGVVTLSLLGRATELRWGALLQLPSLWSLLEQPPSTSPQPVPMLWLPRISTGVSAVEQKQSAALTHTLHIYLLHYLNHRAEQLARTHGLRYRAIVLSNARTLWGTCRRDGLIRMNWRLLFLDVALVDYVLAHELAHTVEMNHSARFWAVVEQMCPDYRARRKALRAYDLRAA